MQRNDTHWALACVLGWVLLGASSLMAQGRPVPRGPVASTEEPPLAGESDQQPIKLAEPGLLPAGIETRDTSNGLIQDYQVKPAQAIFPQNSPEIIPGNTLMQGSGFEQFNSNYPATPVVTIRVIGPEAVSIDTEVPYKIIIQNRSNARAHHVLVRCMAPKNAQLIKATPEPTAKQPELQWEMGTLDAGASKTIEVTFRPNPNETDIALTGRVQFDHGQWLGTKISRPGLAVKKVVPPQGIVNETMTFQIEVINTSRVRMADVTVEDALPEGLEFKSDNVPNSPIDATNNKRTWKLASIEGGQKKIITYQVMAKQIMPAKRSLVLVSSGKIREQAEGMTAVVEPRIIARLTGPDTAATIKQRTKYKIDIRNDGTATLNNVRINFVHPADVKLAGASSGSQMYRDMVQWILPKLSPGETRLLTVDVIADTPGNRRFELAVKADRGAEQKAELSTMFDGLAALHWNTQGPTTSTVGKSIEYRILVENTGNAIATNVQVTATLPPEVEFRNQALPQFQIRDRSVVFRPIQIPAKGSTTYTLTVVPRDKGMVKFSFELLSDQMKSGSAFQDKVVTISPEPSNPPPPGKDLPGMISLDSNHQGIKFLAALPRKPTQKVITFPAQDPDQTVAANRGTATVVIPD
jgi:uncharacterized repeat protein (TIGR01451 family)